MSTKVIAFQELGYCKWWSVLFKILYPIIQWFYEQSFTLYLFISKKDRKYSIVVIK